MPVTHEDVDTTLKRYLTAHPDRVPEVCPLARALGAGLDLSWSTSFPLHVTCSGAAIDPAGAVLMIQYDADEGWRLPGEHLERTDRSLYDAALRALEEGTGIAWRYVAIAPRPDVLPVDIDILEISANAALREPAHLHADFRYAFRARDTRLDLRPVEVPAFGWFPPGEPSLTRWAI
jgi:hypothetical protein